VAVVAVDLWRTVRDQDERAALFAARDAERSARALRTALLDASVLDDLPAEEVFTVESGELAVPEPVGWLSPPARFDPERDLDVVLRDRLLRATRGDGGAGEGVWDAMRGDPTADEATSAWLAAPAALRFLDGLPGALRYQRDLRRWTAQRLEHAWGVRPAAPDHALASMVAVPPTPAAAWLEAGVRAEGLR